MLAASEVAVDPSELNCCQVDTSEAVDIAGMLTLALSCSEVQLIV